MPITNKDEAKDGGFAQLKRSLVKFKMDVKSAEFGKWDNNITDDYGNYIPPKEYLEIKGTNFVALETTEPLSMNITDWSFRINCSDYSKSFWVDKFLESADKFKILIPDGLIGKRVTFQRVTIEAFDRNGNPVPKYNTTNYIIAGIEDV